MGARLRSSPWTTIAGDFTRAYPDVDKPGRWTNRKAPSEESAFVRLLRATKSAATIT